MRGEPGEEGARLLAGERRSGEPVSRSDATQAESGEPPSPKQAPGEAALLAALFSSPEERARRLKRIMAEQFQDMEAATSVLDGPDGSTILTERNKAALGVLKSELAKGKKKIAIFYGAAHLADMEERLIAEFGLKRTGATWVTAWDLSGKPRENAAAK